mmetsp:Transcript_61670/g.193303  ORF Transcript_61670/g.193303 Transcript_61670/m.193303 type:complete len:243 (+) Transcript_61670:1366-2094(+)
MSRDPRIDPESLSTSCVTAPSECGAGPGSSWPRKLYALFREVRRPLPLLVLWWRSWDIRRRPKFLESSSGHFLKPARRDAQVNSDGLLPILLLLSAGRPVTAPVGTLSFAKPSEESSSKNSPEPWCFNTAASFLQESANPSDDTQWTTSSFSSSTEATPLVGNLGLECSSRRKAFCMWSPWGRKAFSMWSRMDVNSCWRLSLAKRSNSVRRSCTEMLAGPRLRMRPGWGERCRAARRVGLRD